jgi:hypothetical protein
VKGAFDVSEYDVKALLAIAWIVCRQSCAISSLEPQIKAKAMPYKIEQKRNGIVKRFTGFVTYKDVLKSEQEVSVHPDYTALQYVISDYIGAVYNGISDDQQAVNNALRIGGHRVNPRIKYAFVLQDPGVRVQIKDAVASGVMRHTARIFDTYEEAAAWVGL